MIIKIDHFFSKRNSRHHNFDLFDLLVTVLTLVVLGFITF